MKNNNQLIKIGKIVSAHGIKGFVNIISYTENPKNIANYKQILTSDQKIISQIKIIGEPKGKNKDIFLAEIKDIKNRNQAELLSGIELYIKRDELPDLDDNEFYYSDLEKLEVIDLENKKIGQVIAINDFGAGGMLEIELYEADKSNNKTYLLPFRDFIFPEINLKENYIKMIIPEFIEWQEDGVKK